MSALRSPRVSRQILVKIPYRGKDMGCSRLMGADDEAAHRRGDMFEVRRELMQVWAWTGRGVAARRSRGREGRRRIAPVKGSSKSRRS
jgi:hypothetical protein